MALFERVSRWFRPEPIATVEALEAFLDSRAAFMAQKCVVEYCRARSGVLWQKLFKEEAFLAALHRSRWTAYAIAYCDLAEMIEGVLRDRLGDQAARLEGALAAMAERVFWRHGVPEGAPDDFWEQAMGRLRRRLALARMRAPRPVRDIPKTDIDEVFASLPIHPSLRGHDFELVQNHLRTNIVRIYEDFLAAVDLDRVASRLVAASVEVGAVETGQGAGDHL